MMRRRKTAGLLATVCAATGLALGMAGSALADSTRNHDPADATGSNTDIRTVQVDHRAEKVVTTVDFTKLARNASSVAGLEVFLDTDPSEQGPEYRLSSGLERGTDYALLRMRDWETVGERLTCDHQVELEYANDSAVTSVSGACLGNPDEVRVGVKMTDAADGSHPITDWLDGPRQWTRWLATG